MYKQISLSLVLCLWSLFMTAQIDTISTGNRVDINLDLVELSEMLQVFQEKIDQLEYVVDSITWNCGDVFSYNNQDYATVEIGSQCWFKENLNSGSFADGTLIGNGTDVSDNVWAWATNPLCAPFDNDQTYRPNYGLMYNGYAALANVCPSGWLVPTESDFSKLFNILGGVDVAGGKMKATSVNSIPWNGEDSHGFTALPGGYRNGSGGGSGHFGDKVKFWTSTEYSGELGVLRLTTGGTSAADMTGDAMRTGAYIRCFKGSAVSAAVDEAIEEAVPTQLSELNNDLGLMTATDVFVMADGNNISGFIQPPSMTGWGLENHDFYNANLFGAEMWNGDFSNSNFNYATLEHANLQGADLSGCSFKGANLRNADLTGANLTGADFTDADLTGADLTNATTATCSTNFGDANMSGVILMPGQFADMYFGHPSTYPPGYTQGGCPDANGNVCFICNSGYVYSIWKLQP